MKALLTATGVLASTLLLTSAFLWIDPFAGVNRALDAAFGAAPQWTQVTNVVLDPDTQDVYHNERPLTSFRHLAEYWHSRQEARRVLLIGNSQMFSLSLAKGELPQHVPEPTYPDSVSRVLEPANILSYRLAAPGLSYSEALYEIEYLLRHPGLRPSLIVLQINYQAFWNSGIRESLDELLADSAFHQRARELTKSGEPYSDDFASAVTRFEERETRPGAEKPTQQVGFGPGLESYTRRQLSGLELYNRRHLEKDSFEGMLYRMRLYFLRIKPSNARSISGPQLTRSQAAVRAIAESCRAAGVRLAIFTAPLNPAVSLYKSPEDESQYEEFVRTLAGNHHLPLLRLDSSVPGGLWGRQFNGPDPLHMGRAGHTVVAGKMAPFIQDLLKEN